MTDSLSALAAATNNELYDPEFRGGEWLVEAVETAETLEQWEESSARWNERSSMKAGTIGGLRFLAWKRIQVRPGQARQSMSVVDLGAIRVALPGTDLSMF